MTKLKREQNYNVMEVAKISKKIPCNCQKCKCKTRVKCVINGCYCCGD